METPSSNVATVNITVNSVNDAPVANDDFTSTNEDTPVVIDVVANDTDSDGNIDPTSVAITAQPSHGSLQVNVRDRSRSPTRQRSTSSVPTFSVTE